MKYKLDHIGIAVETLEQGKAFYEALGLSPMHVETVEKEKVKVGLFDLENDCRIELLEPLSKDSTIQKYLEKRGPGIHHICLRVEGIRDILKTLKKGGVTLINEEPHMGAHNCLVAFIHPKSTGGVLIELSEQQGK